jgi:hypothetical protein
MKQEVGDKQTISTGIDIPDEYLGSKADEEGYYTTKKTEDVFVFHLEEVYSDFPLADKNNCEEMLYEFVEEIKKENIFFKLVEVYAKFYSYDTPEDTGEDSYGTFHLYWSFYITYENYSILFTTTDFNLTENVGIYNPPKEIQQKLYKKLIKLVKECTQQNIGEGEFNQYYITPGFGSFNFHLERTYDDCYKEDGDVIDEYCEKIKNENPLFDDVWNERSFNKYDDDDDGTINPFGELFVDWVFEIKNDNVDVLISVDEFNLLEYFQPNSVTRDMIQQDLEKAFERFPLPANASDNVIWEWKKRRPIVTPDYSTYSVTDTYTYNILFNLLYDLYLIV